MNDKFNYKEFLTEGRLFKEVDDDVKKIEPSIRDMFLEYGTAEEINQYLASLTKDLNLNGSDAYHGWTKDDFLEDFRNYVNDKGLGEGFRDFKKEPGLDYEPTVDKGETSTDFIDNDLDDDDGWNRDPSITMHIDDEEWEREMKDFERKKRKSKENDEKDYEPFDEGIHVNETYKKTGDPRWDGPDYDNDSDEDENISYKKTGDPRWDGPDYDNDTNEGDENTSYKLPGGVILTPEDMKKLHNGEMVRKGNSTIMFVDRNKKNKLKENLKKRLKKKIEEGDNPVSKQFEKDYYGDDEPNLNFENNPFGEWEGAGEDAEKFFMMDGDAHMDNLSKFRHYLTIVLSDWIGDSDYGWEKEDVKDIINYMIDQQY